MPSAYSTTKVLFLLILVEASLCLSSEEDLSRNGTEFLKDTSEGCYYRVTLPSRRLRRPIKDLRYRVKSNNLAPRGKTTNCYLLMCSVPKKKKKLLMCRY